MLTKIKSLVKTPAFWIGAGVLVLLALAFRSKVPAVIKDAAKKIPGADQI